MNRLLDLLFPPICAGCGELLPIGGDVFCPICRGKWEQEKRMGCPVCGKPHVQCDCPIMPPYILGKAKDHSALRNGLQQFHLSAYLPGTPTVTGRMILRAKDRKLRVHRRLFGSELAPRLAKRMRQTGELPILSYIPRKPSKVRLTGTDQARELARGVGDALGLSVTALLSRHGGKDQKMKNAAERFATTAACYRLTRKGEHQVAGREVWLCDDVITTGASVLACAALLIRAGAKRVIALAVARTQNDQEEQDEKENGY